MKTIKLTDKAYEDLLELKNHIIRKIDKDPKYDFSECIIDIVGMIWHEQETGEVDSIS
jgi:predicted CopG family antitoxin